MNTTDMHPFIDPLTAAVDPVWESRSDWEIFKSIKMREVDWRDRPLVEKSRYKEAAE